MYQIGIKATRWEILPNVFGPTDEADHYLSVNFRASMRDRYGQRVALNNLVYPEIMEYAGQAILEEMWREFKRGLSERFNSKFMYWSYSIGSRWENHGFSL